MKKTNQYTEKARYWRGVFKLQQSSGKTIKEFCREQRLNHHTYSYWKVKLNSDGASTRRKKSFIPVVIQQGLSGRIRTRVQLPNGVSVEMGDDLDCANVVGLIKSLCGIGHEQN